MKAFVVKASLLTRLGTWAASNSSGMGMARPGIFPDPELIELAADKEARAKSLLEAASALRIAYAEQAKRYQDLVASGDVVELA